MAKKALSIVANCGHAQLTKALRVEETKQKQNRNKSSHMQPEKKTKNHKHASIRTRRRANDGGDQT